TSFLRANRSHPTVYATTPADAEAGVLIDMAYGDSAADLGDRGADHSAAGPGRIGTVADELTASARSGLSPHLDHVLRVADPFHVVRVANRCLDKVRRPVQQETLGRRGRKDDPLYKIRKLLLTGDERPRRYGPETDAVGTASRRPLRRG